MAFPGNSETDLLLALQDGAVGTAGWIEFLARLAGLTGAEFAAMVGRSAGSDHLTSAAASAPSGASPTAGAGAIGAILIDRIRPERIYDEADLAELANAEEGEAMRAAFDRLGIISVRAMRVVVPDAASFVLGIVGKERFDAADSAVLRRLFPYLQAALRTADRIGRERLRATIAAEQMRRASSGWFLLDRAGAVIETSLETADLPHGIRILPSPQGDRLIFAERSAESALAAILHRLASHSDAGSHALRVTPGFHLRVAAAPIPSASRAVALATLHGQSRLIADAATLMVDLFGLLPSEARLAAAIADGHGLVDAAEALGLTIETVRNYSKKIFAKTGTQGQADLVRLIFANGLAELPHT